MANCGQACPYNTLDGCKVKEYNAICPLTNMATPVTEYRMTNADRIRAMSDEALCERLYHVWRNEADKGNDIAINWCDPECCTSEECDPDKHKACILRWLQQPAVMEE